jgi:hypothetical protein
MRSFLFTVLFCALSLSGICQEPAKQELHPCGAPTGVSDFLEKYQKNPWLYAQPESGDTLWVAVQVHLLAKDSGAGRIPWDRLLAAFPSPEPGFCRKPDSVLHERTMESAR